jgi:uncharacterized protein
MNPKPRFPWTFVLITFTFTWLILLPGILSSKGIFDLPIPIYALVAVAQFGPSLTALFMIRRHEGKPGAIRFLKRALNFRIPFRWLAFIFLFPPAVNAVALLFHRISGGTLPEMPYLSQPAAILPSFIFILMLQGPLPEEFGWRGYLLDRLQAKWTGLFASLVLGALWWLWHLPAAFMEGIAQSYFPQLAYLVWCMAVSVLFTWMYNHTGGNLAAALLFHTLLNLSNAIFPPLSLTSGGNQAAFLYVTAIYVLAAVVVTLVWGPRHLADRAYTIQSWPASHSRAAS